MTHRLTHDHARTRCRDERRRTAPSPAAGKPLVIVESPAKARTIAGLLGPGLRGRVLHRPHPRPAPPGRRGARPPTRARPGPASGVDVDNGFKPLYVVSPEKKYVVAKLKQLRQGRQRGLPGHGRGPRGRVDRLAPPRGARRPRSRSSGWSSTRSPRPAIERAVEEWRDLDRRLVDAQEARRILDRLYGYEVSPVLWKKVMPRLSAGRVQSVATRMVVERERARMRFRSAGPGGASTAPSPPGEPAGPSEAARSFTAALVAVDGTPGRHRPRLRRRRASSPRPGRWWCSSEAEARRLAAGLAGRPFTVKSVTEQAVPALAGAAVHDLDPAAGGRPQAPLQRPAGHAGGPAPLRAGLDHLHAHRLDHPVRRGPGRRPGPGRAALRRRVRARRARGATSARSRTPRRPTRPSAPPARPSAPPTRPRAQLSRRRAPPLRAHLEAHGRLPDGRRHRARAPRSASSGRPDGADGTGGRGPSSRASGTVITFPGFLRAYVEGADDPEAELADREVQLPALAEGDVAAGRSLEAEVARHPAAGPLHRGLAGQGASRSWASGGPPPTPASSPPSRTAATCGRRAPRWSRRSPPSPSSACSSATSPTWSTTGSPPRWRTTSTRSPTGRGGAAVAHPLLLRRQRRNGPGDGGTTDRGGHGCRRRGLKASRGRPPGRDRRPGDQLDPDRRRRRGQRDRGPGRAATGPPPARRGPGLGPRGPGPRRADRRAGRGAAGGAVGRPGARRPTPRRGLPVLARAGRFGPYVQLGEADRRRASRGPRRCSQSMSPDTVDPRAGAASCSACRGRSAPTRRAARRSSPQRPLRPVSEEGDRHPQPRARSSCSRSPWTRRWRCSPSPRRAGAGQRAAAPRARRRPRHRASHGRHATGRFGPYVTDGTTNASLAQGRRRRSRSRSSGPPSCWPSAGPPGRRRRRPTARRPPPRRRRPRRAAAKKTRRRRRRPRRRRRKKAAGTASRRRPEGRRCAEDE